MNLTKDKRYWKVELFCQIRPGGSRMRNSLNMFLKGVLGLLVNKLINVELLDRKIQKRAITNRGIPCLHLLRFMNIIFQHLNGIELLNFQIFYVLSREYQVFVIWFVTLKFKIITKLIQSICFGRRAVPEQLMREDLEKVMKHLKLMETHY